MAPAVAVSKPSPPVGERRRHEQDEQRAHPVVAEALPHLGEEQRGEPAGVAEKPVSVAGSRLGLSFRASVT